MATYVFDHLTTETLSHPLQSQTHWDGAVSGIIKSKSIPHTHSGRDYEFQDIGIAASILDPFLCHFFHWF